MRLAHPAPGVKHQQSLSRQDGRQQHFARLDLPAQEFDDIERQQLAARRRLIVAGRERAIDKYLDRSGAREVRHIVKVLEIIRSVWAEVGSCDYTGNRSSRFSCLRDAGVSDGAVIVIGQQDELGVRVFRPERFGNG